MSSSHRPVRSVLLASLVVLSAAFAGVGVGSVAAVTGERAPSLQQDDTAENSTLGPADDVWVNESGDLVLRYQDGESSPDAGEESNVEYGLAVSEGLLYGLATAESTTETDSNVTGGFHALLTPDQFAGNGSLTAPRPEAVESMTLDVSGERTTENAQFDATAELVVDDQEAGVASLLRNADVSAQARVGATSFTSSGELSAELTTPMGRPQLQEFTVTESDGGYTVEAVQKRTVSEFTRERWNTSERAKQTLEAQYGSFARSVGGSSEITLESYDFTANSDGSYTLDVEYTVEYANVEQGISQQLAATLAASEDVELSQSEARDLAERVTELQINEVSGSFEQTAEGQVNGAYTVDIENYDRLATAILDVAESVDSEEFAMNADQLEQARAQLEAQKAADLVRTYSMTASVTAEDQGTSTFTLEAQSRTENWQAYVSELQSRDVPVGDLTYSLTGGTEGEEIAVEGEVTLKQEDLVDVYVEQIRQAVNQSATEDADTQRARQLLRAFEAAEFQKAKTDVTFENGDVRIEAGAKFDNLAALRDVVSMSQGGGLTVTEVVGRTESERTNSYVYVRGGVAADASESDVRALAVVDEETTVHMPGDWNRSFPEMDRQRARDYLDVTATPDGSGSGESTPDGSSAFGPGFGVGIALVALLGAALLATRRR